MASSKIPPLASQYIDGEPPVINPPRGSGSNKDASVIIAAINAITSLFGYGLSAYSQHRANQTNINLAEEAYHQNLLQWQRETGYNSPSAQRQRLIEAGLNPGLMYHNGAAGGLAPSSPEMDNSIVEPLFSGSSFGGSAADIGSAYMQNKLLQEQIRGQQLQNDITEETRPTLVGNLRKEGALLDKRIVTETVNQSLAKIRTDHEHMEELRSQARFVLESDKFDYEIDDLIESIRGKRIDNDFAESTKVLRKSILASNAKDASNRAKMSGQQAEQEAVRIAVIGVMNREMAIDQYLIDEYYSQYTALNLHGTFAYGGSVKQSGTMSPYEWLESLTNEQRLNLLAGKTENIYINGRSKSAFTEEYKPAKISWRQAMQHDRYKNLYYKRLNTSNLSPYTQGVFSQSGTSSSLGVKGMSINN